MGPAGVSSVAACMALASAYGDVVIDSIVAQRAKGESLVIFFVQIREVELEKGNGRYFAVA